jgi:pyruvate/2-oxoglutarate dehydrogenase complex dihydrolipoamide dehydrogenase (E3) component
VWTMAPAVVLVDKLGRQSTFEVYIGGDVKARRYSLVEAKEYAAKQFGEPLAWRLYKPTPQEADHYYYSETVEFTDPTICYLGSPSHATWPGLETEEEEG